MNRKKSIGHYDLDHHVLRFNMGGILKFKIVLDEANLYDII